jgi:4Fe-4S ferredoxin
MKLIPIIDPRRCEGKADCVSACPHAVFEVRALDASERAALPLLSRLKLAIHGGRQAFVVRPEQCAACGLCVQRCPEKAIKLQRRP